MQSYRTDYSNHGHMLLVSVSRHLYILKNRTLKSQKKKMEYNFKNLHKAERELVIHYLIADHFSGVFYGEIHSSEKMIPVEEFLYRAWSKKADFPFCGLPTMLSVPKTVYSEELINLVSNLGIIPVDLTGGFMGGVKHLSIWEDSVFYWDYSYYFQNKKHLTFEEIQKQNVEICISEAQRDLKRGGGNLGKKIELWERGINELKLPPPKNEFLSLKN